MQVPLVLARTVTRTPREDASSLVCSAKVQTLGVELVNEIPLVWRTVLPSVLAADAYKKAPDTGTEAGLIVSTRIPWRENINVCVTCAAGRKLLSPAWFAANVHVKLSAIPASGKRGCEEKLPLPRFNTWQGPEVTEYVIASFDDEVAFKGVPES